VAKLSPEERSALIAERPEYGRIICRCESISEGEIIDAIERNPGARSMDGIKRRVRQGMGRCQAGFCTPGAMDILAERLGIPVEKVTKNRPGSELLKW
jgi:glycerol-3-phosphate dehydrogenase